MNQVFDEIKERYLKIVNRDTTRPDPQETAEREGATSAYAAENEKHFVDYLADCVSTSHEANKEIREIQGDCWRAFQEKEPLSYRFKEEWQSRVVIPKPFSSVMSGAAAVKKAFSPDFLTIEKEGDPLAEAFWREVLAVQLDNRHANFVTRFVDATIMGLAVGQSMEIIPSFSVGQGGVRLDLVEPWKIVRDPDAPSRDPQGGLYWIHQEWLDYHLLKNAEKQGKYHDVARVKNISQPDPLNPLMTQEAIARRKEQIWTRSKFRKLILTSEFYGTILSPGGEELLASGTYTCAGGRLIGAPRSTPYQWLRWPGISFSPMPDLLRHGGRGLLEGIISLWESMCNIMCLHEDGLKFLINPPQEVNVQSLVDPTDIDDWPGKKYLTRDTVSGHQVVRAIDRRDVTNSVLGNLQYHDQLFQRGSMVTDAVQGLPGYRAEVTAHESAQNLDQAMGVFGLMGGNLEDGAVNILTAIVDVIVSFTSGASDLFCHLKPETQQQLLRAGGRMPELHGNFSVSGMSELLRQADTLRYLTTTVFPMAQSETWAPFINRHNALRAFEARTNLKDENIFIDEKTAEMQMGATPQGAPDGTAAPGGGDGQAGLANQDRRGPKVASAPPGQKGQ